MNEMTDTIESLRAENERLKARAERTEAACAAKDAALKECEAVMADAVGVDWADFYGASWDQMQHALSLDCGKDYVQRAELEKVQAAAAEMRNLIEHAVAADADKNKWAYAVWTQFVADGLRLLNSSDCGSGLVAPEKAAIMRTALEKIASLQDGNVRLLEGGCAALAKAALEVEK